LKTPLSLPFPERYGKNIDPCHLGENYEDLRKDKDNNKGKIVLKNMHNVQK
jgi:hypothetical protein